MLKALSLGIALAVIVVVVSVVLFALGVVPLANQQQPPSRILIVGTGPDGQGVEVAVFAFVLNSDEESTSVLDVTADVSVSGTSVHTPREAYPFVGADGMSSLLQEQSNGLVEDWIVLPANVWSELVDEAGGVEVEVEDDISVYRDGSLVVLDSGSQRLTGDELVALTSGADFSDDEVLRATLGRVAEAATSIVTPRVSALGDAVRSGRATSNMKADRIDSFAKE